MIRRPRITPARDWSFPRHEESRLGNGLTVWAFHLPRQYVVSAALSLDLPLSLEPTEQEGIAAITARSLDEGTRRHPGSDFSARLEDLGAVFGASATLSGTQVGISVPVTDLAAALPLLAEAVREPSLAEADIRRQVGLRKAELVQARASSAQLAAMLTPASVFDAGCRASRPSGGSTRTVSAVTAEAAQAFHRSHYSPHGATLVLAGDFAGLDPLWLAERAFGDWEHPRQAARHQPPVPTAPSQRLVARPEAVQADVRLLGFCCDRLDPRWPALQVAAVAMGGAFQSRLNTVLRERRGWTYGVHMTWQALRGAGYLAVTSSLRTEVVAPALAETRRLLDVTRRPFTKREVARAIRYQTDIAPLRYATAAAVCQQTLVLATHGLDPSYLDRNLALQRHVTPEQATTAYADLWPAEPALLVVGQPSLAGPLQVPAQPVPQL